MFFAISLKNTSLILLYMHLQFSTNNNVTLISFIIVEPSIVKFCIDYHKSIINAENN